MYDTLSSAAWMDHTFSYFAGAGCFEKELSCFVSLWLRTYSIIGTDVLNWIATSTSAYCSYTYLPIVWTASFYLVQSRSGSGHCSVWYCFNTRFLSKHGNQPSHVTNHYHIARSALVIKNISYTKSVAQPISSLKSGKYIHSFGKASQYSTLNQVQKRDTQSQLQQCLAIQHSQ